MDAAKCSAAPRKFTGKFPGFWRAAADSPQGTSMETNSNYAARAGGAGSWRMVPGGAPHFAWYRGESDKPGSIERDKSNSAISPICENSFIAVTETGLNNL